MQRGDLARIADLKYGALPEYDNRLKTLRASAPADAMLTEELGPEEIAAVVSRWVRESKRELGPSCYVRPKQQM